MLIPGSRIKPRQVKSCTFPAGRGVEKAYMAIEDLIGMFE